MASFVTLVTGSLLEMTLAFAMIRFTIPVAQPWLLLATSAASPCTEILSRAVFWSIVEKDQRLFTCFVHSFNHIKGFGTKVV